jgi:hypothetical protein
MFPSAYLFIYLLAILNAIANGGHTTLAAASCKDWLRRNEKNFESVVNCAMNLILQRNSDLSIERGAMNSQGYLASVIIFWSAIGNCVLNFQLKNKEVLTNFNGFSQD